MLMLAKSDKKKNVGTLLTGFSILMFGMHTMSSAVSPLADVPEFTGLLVKFSIPVLGVLAGTIPVSYTHLDVYKRQRESGVSSSCRSSRIAAIGVLI